MQLVRITPNRLPDDDAPGHPFGKIEQHTDTHAGEVVVVGAFLEDAGAVGQGAAVVEEDDAVHYRRAGVGQLVFRQRAADAQFGRHEVAAAAGEQAFGEAAHGVGAADLEEFAGGQEAGVGELQPAAGEQLQALAEAVEAGGAAAVVEEALVAAEVRDADRQCVVEVPRGVVGLVFAGEADGEHPQVQPGLLEAAEFARR